MARALAATRIALVVEAVIRCKGNLTHAGELIRLSRRQVRETLVDAGLHPWPKDPPPDNAATFVAVLFALGTVGEEIDPEDEPARERPPPLDRNGNDDA